MDAMEKGYKRGREYLRRCPIEKTTFEQYKAMGKVDVKQQYKQKKAQDQYLLGWWHAGEQFASLFKPDDNDSYSAVKRIKSIQQRLQGCVPIFNDLLDFREDDDFLQETLSKAVEAFEQVLDCLDLINDHLKKD
jgi:hypothetical protein